MRKKTFAVIIFSILFSVFSNVIVSSADEVQLKPLKIMQTENTNYKYGNFEKTFKNPFNNINDSENQDKEQRRVFSVLDVLNNFVFVFFVAFVGILIGAKIKNISLHDLLHGKFHKKNNKFKVLARKELDDFHNLYLVEINAKQFIISTTDTKVDLITPFDKNYSQEEIPDEYIEKLFNNNTDVFKKL